MSLRNPKTSTDYLELAKRRIEYTFDIKLTLGERMLLRQFNERAYSATINMSPFSPSCSRIDIDSANLFVLTYFPLSKNDKEIAFNCICGCIPAKKSMKEELHYKRAEDNN